MKLSRTLLILCILAGLFAVIQAGAGLFYHPAGDPFTVTSIHGEEVELYGRGIYAYDTYFKAPINRGTDAEMLFVCIPMLAAALYFYNRGSLRGKVFLTGVLAYMLYTTTSFAIGVAYNNLFLLYIASFSASLFAFVLSFSSIDLPGLAKRTTARLPRRGIVALMIVSIVGLIAAWVPELVIAVMEGGIPPLNGYTTMITDVLDLGIIVPACALAAVLILRKDPLGTLTASTLMIVLINIAVVVTSQTIFQTAAGITVPVPVLVIKAGTFVVMGFFAVWLTARLIGSIAEKDVPETKSRKVARA